MRILGRRISPLVLVFLMFACSGPPPAAEEPLFRQAVDDLDGLVAGDVAFDSTTSSDGNGSIRIAAAQPMTVRLYEVADVDVENARIVYRARLRTENLQGQAYLEMWCRFPGKGEFFSRAMQAPLSGSNEWVSQETPFLLERGQNPDHIALNVVLTGPGTVWVDDIALLKASR